MTTRTTTMPTANASTANARIRTLATALGAASLLASTAAPADRGTDGVLTRLVPDDPATVAAGEAVYAANCASCHGAALEGQPDWRSRDASGLLPAPPHDASGHTWHHADDLLFEIVKYGPAAVIGDEAYRSAMPAYEGVLDDSAIVAVLSHVASTWPEQEREWQREVNGAQLELLGESPSDGSVLERLFR